MFVEKKKCELKYTRLEKVDGPEKQEASFRRMSKVGTN